MLPLIVRLPCRQMGRNYFINLRKFKAQRGGVRHIMHAKIQLKQKYKH